MKLDSHKGVSLFFVESFGNSIELSVLLRYFRFAGILDATCRQTVFLAS